MFDVLNVLLTGRDTILCKINSFYLRLCRDEKVKFFYVHLYELVIPFYVGVAESKLVL